MSGRRLIGVRQRKQRKPFKADIYTDKRRECEKWQSSPPQTPTTSDDEEDGHFDDLSSLMNPLCIPRWKLVKTTPIKHEKYWNHTHKQQQQQQHQRPESPKLNVLAMPFVPDKKRERETIAKLDIIEEDMHESASQSVDDDIQIYSPSLLSTTTTTSAMDDLDSYRCRENRIEFEEDTESDDEDEDEKEQNQANRDKIEFAEILDDDEVEIEQDQEEEFIIYDREREYFDDDRFAMLADQILDCAQTSPYKLRGVRHCFGGYGNNINPQPHLAVFRPNNIWTEPKTQFEQGMYCTPQYQ